MFLKRRPLELAVHYGHKEIAEYIASKKKKVRKMQKYIKHIYTRCKAVAPLPVCRLISQPLAIKALTTGSFAFF